MGGAGRGTSGWGWQTAEEMMPLSDGASPGNVCARQKLAELALRFVRAGGGGATPDRAGASAAVRGAAAVSCAGVARRVAVRRVGGLRHGAAPRRGSGFPHGSCVVGGLPRGGVERRGGEGRARKLSDPFARRVAVAAHAKKKRY
jgi:hypothetical protein